MDALAAANDAAVQAIDTFIVGIHQHRACITRSGFSRWDAPRVGWRAGFLRSLIPTACRSGSRQRLVGKGPVSPQGSTLLVDRGCDADWDQRTRNVVERVALRGACGHLTRVRSVCCAEWALRRAQFLHVVPETARSVRDMRESMPHESEQKRRGSKCRTRHLSNGPYRR